MYCLQASFCPDILQAGAVQGLTQQERLPGQFESSKDTEHIQSMDEAISAPYNCLGQAVLIVPLKLRHQN